MTKLPSPQEHPKERPRRRPLLKQPEKRSADQSEASKQERLEEGLQAIYADRSGSVPDLTRLERTRSHRWLGWLVGIVIFFAIAASAAWVGFFVLQPFRQFEGRGLELSLEGPRSIILGEEQMYRIHWSNAATTPLSQAEVRIGLPFDFAATLFGPSPTDPNLRVWKLGFLPVGSQGDIQIKGVFTGSLGTQTSIQAIGSFRPSTFSKDFETATSVAITYEKSVLLGTIDAPSKLIAGDVATFVYHLQNQGKQTMKDLAMHISMPEGFLFQASTSSGHGLDLSRDSIFSVPILLPGASTTVAWTGSFAAGTQGDRLFQVDVGRRDPQGNLIAYDHREARVPIVPGDLALQLVVNGSSVDRSMIPGDALRITVGYQNTSPETLKNVVLRVGFESLLNGTSTRSFSWLVWPALDDPSHGVSTTKAVIQTLRYDKTQLTELASLASQQEGRIELSLPTLPVVTGTKDGAIRISVEAEVPVVGGTKVQRMVRVKPILMRYRSDADASVEARAFTEEGAPLGFGPLPPVAGKTTAYRIFWHLDKSFHALDGASFTTVLPKNSAWSARSTADAGTVSYDPASRVVRWTVDKVGESVRDLEASFEVQLTPSLLDIGRFADLIGETRFQAKDSVVDETISVIKPALSTDLQNDEGAKGKGVVRKE